MGVNQAKPKTYGLDVGYCSEKPYSNLTGHNIAKPAMIVIKIFFSLKTKILYKQPQTQNT
jgi:hypothetical protein